MATTRKSTKSEAVEETVETPKQLINAGITRVVEETGVDMQHARYKAMRAIAYQAFVESIGDNDFDDLVTRAIANADNLPAGWELERTSKEDAAPKAKTAPRKTAAKATAKTPAKPAARKRPKR